ncbi:MAG: NAD(P)H-dependent dehydrogenase/reductase [Desulfobacteraceae bacterium 4572_35.1]|nr:MAG: NAD(P)H-dependent dehydrogenase/reductase [Desulfobacteraceae bacterium 4572_35.1]
MLLDILRNRRSIRQFTNKQLSTEHIAQLKEVILRAPTSRGLNPWQFIFVTNPEILAKLAQAKAKGSTFIANSALAVVICADTTRSDVWTEDCAIAAICLQLAVTELGLGSCWSQIRLRSHDENSSAGKYVTNLLKLPSNIDVDCIIAIGYPAEEKGTYPTDELAWSHIKDIN